MNAKSYTNLTQNFSRRTVRRLVAMALLLSVTAYSTLWTWQPASATGPDRQMLYQMVLDGQGQGALDQVADAARALGGWQPAPGDAVVFDPYMARGTRGSSPDVDELPDCDDPNVSADPETCVSDFQAREREVRFGRSLFSTRGEDGTEALRASFDDLLSTYIEEAGHSWQEYQYETRGAASGARVVKTTRNEAERWAAGREYQVKRYILSLDGSLLSLSEEQREMLRGQICKGYANPTGQDVPAYGAPAGWPNPQGWPTTAPTAEEWQSFCAGM